MLGSTTRFSSTAPPLVTSGVHHYTGLDPTHFPETSLGCDGFLEEFHERPVAPGVTPADGRPYLRAHHQQALHHTKGRDRMHRTHVSSVEHREHNTALVNIVALEAALGVNVGVLVSDLAHTPLIDGS